MADEKDLQIEEGGGKSKKMLFIIIAVVVLIAGGGGAFFMMSGDDTPAQEETLAENASADGAKSEAADKSSAEMGSALYVGMPRPFVFNVPGASRDRLVQIKVQLLVRGDVNEEAAKKHIPLIEGTLLSVFSTSNADELSTSAGKETLRTKALKNVQDTLTEIEGNKVVERILFTGFVMQ
ncbi:flagellar basal body-associated protein FliL [Pseudoalteromonas tunicata]|jgi:flagellar FliL protein|uniref:Flagellar protein FliL n=1 Tax=Pseudoalteromonas tunicata D2 TaxID=87626 RepID=A4C6C8_9GAMM|nr:flagellar basal body-associated protein FliL [Pseudoalteromonas tunicata]ATC95507.1 flagellar FliL protein [Pseudoalteromonas tunicata]AXT31081.1 flagellar basal body-associated protein FliL [Pseudoalteromonas tunicata]EAR29532.1 flagellar basal body-associated protein [Pseudoalteromonas tunicata D2]